MEHEHECVNVTVSRWIFTKGLSVLFWPTECRTFKWTFDHFHGKKSRANRSTIPHLATLLERLNWIFHLIYAIQVIIIYLRWTTSSMINLLQTCWQQPTKFFKCLVKFLFSLLFRCMLKVSRLLFWCEWLKADWSRTTGLYIFMFTSNWSALMWFSRYVFDMLLYLCCM